MTTRQLLVPVSDGGVPVHVAGAQDASLAGVVVVPSIFGPAADLLDQMASLSDVAFTAVMDPFWRQGGGCIPYGDVDAALARLEELDRLKCQEDVDAVSRWVRQQSNGRVIGLGICFGGPWVLVGAARGLLSGVVTWHGSRMEAVLDILDGLSAPLRLHFGDEDPITPPAAIEAITRRFADHPDCQIVIHPGAEHGFSHDGPAWDAAATDAGLIDLRDLITTSSS